MTNLPIIIKIEKSTLDGYIVKKYEQLNGITKEIEIVFIKEKEKVNVESFEDEDSYLLIKNFLVMLNNLEFIWKTDIKL